jgi:hypothetical protein
MKLWICYKEANETVEIFFNSRFNRLNFILIKHLFLNKKQGFDLIKKTTKSFPHSCWNNAPAGQFTLPVS